MFITGRGLAAISTVLLAVVLHLNAQSASGLANTQTIRAGIASAGSGSNTYTVRTMPLEDYVAGVLAGEAYPNSSDAALEALAITVRTYAVANRGRHAADGFDLCDLTHCQVLRKPTAATTRAAAATAGCILLYEGAAASVFYSASCGGHSERPSEVWPGAADPPFLQSRPDDADDREPAWAADLTAADLGRALRAAGFRGDVLRDLTIAGRNRSHRVSRLRLAGFSPAEISGPDFRSIVGRTLGWQQIKSTAFDVSRNAHGFHFAGHGSGHGVGLCVLGSLRLAARGDTADEILARYFRGLMISPLRSLLLPAATPASARGIAVSLPEGEQGERDVLRDLAASARDRLAEQLGVTRPAQLSLRFHPTVESYQQATGKPWFTGGATVGREMHFVPLAVLRERGILDRTIRHELAHALTEPALAGRPAWVREGAALYFAREQSERDQTAATGHGRRGACPTDRELLQPSSPGALVLAYDRAAACFADRLRAGKGWRDIE
jgi:stage II sporulation protein D